MIQVFQAEWCPYSSMLRQRLTELGVDYVIRQVAPDPPDRDALVDATGGDSIPALVLEDGSVLTGLGWGFFGISIAAFLKSIENFNYVTSAVITPLFLVAGTFFPLDDLPQWAQILGNVNPLFHCVELVRHAVFGFEGLEDVGHLAFLIGFALLAWRMAIRFMERRLVI